jgi:hypothetical protein
MYAADELYYNKPLEHGLKRFFYQSLGWHWDTTNILSKRRNHPPWYNAGGLESVSEHDLEQDADDMPMEWNPRTKLQFE